MGQEMAEGDVVGDGTLRGYADRYLMGKRRRGELTGGSYRNTARYLDTLVDDFGHRPVRQFGPAAVLRWQERIAHLAPATRRNALSAVRMFGRWLVENGVIRRDPCSGVRSPRLARRVPRALTADQLILLVNACPDGRARCIVSLMIFCGLRCVEVSNLQLGDYDARERTIHVRGKGGHERVLPVPRRCAVAVNDWVGERGAQAGPLILSRHPGHPLDGVHPHTISTWVAGWMRDAGIKTRPGDGVSAHALRHSCASDVMDRTRDVLMVQELLGHRQLSTSAIYLRRVSLDRLRVAMERDDDGGGGEAA